MSMDLAYMQQQHLAWRVGLSSILVGMSDARVGDFQLGARSQQQKHHIP